jgi:hypothetical protein
LRFTISKQKRGESHMAGWQNRPNTQAVNAGYPMTEYPPETDEFKRKLNRKSLEKNSAPRPGAVGAKRSSF